MTASRTQQFAQPYPEQLLPGDRFVDEQEASRIDGMSVAWHQRKRWDGSGPPYRRIGRSIRYRLSELVNWFEQHRVRSTSEAVVSCKSDCVER